MDQPASPCINICRMNPATGLCEGCLRSIEEIAAWGSADAEYKTQILQEVARRRARLEAEALDGTGP